MKELLSCQTKEIGICLFCLDEKFVIVWDRDVTWKKCQSLALNLEKWFGRQHLPFLPKCTYEYFEIIFIK
jgi:hypothetical protein